MQEDLEELKREDLTFNHRNCLLFRSGEKEILHFLSELADYVLRLLSMSFREAKKDAQLIPIKFEATGAVRDYLHNIVMPMILKEQKAK